METREPDLFLLGSTHRTAPLDMRERLALSAERIESVYELLKSPSGLALPECLVLNTCNRVELYGVASSAERALELRAQLLEKMGRMHALEPADLERFSFWKQHADVVEHVFGVAAGLDSQMVGETEIFGQVKDSYGEALRRGAAGPVLNRIFQKSFQAAKWARTHTPIGRGAVSVGSVAVELATRIFGDLSRSRVLLVGAGDVGQSAVQAFRSRGVRNVTVASRTLANAQQLASQHEAAAIDLARVPILLAESDIILCALSAETPVITREHLAAASGKRGGEPVFVIDLAMPRNVASGASDLNNIYLYNLDDLAVVANENLNTRLAAVETCRLALSEKARGTWDSLRGR